LKVTLQVYKIYDPIHIFEWVDLGISKLVYKMNMAHIIQWEHDLGHMTPSDFGNFSTQPLDYLVDLSRLSH